jgi:hypothetical protein
MRWRATRAKTVTALRYAVQSDLYHRLSQVYNRSGPVTASEPLLTRSADSIHHYTLK